MTIIESMIQELEQEAQTTRRVLERVPADRLAWKPHDKSMSLGQLAMHVATTPGGVAEMSRQSPYQMPEFEQQTAESATELIPTLEAGVAKAVAILRTIDDAELGGMWRLVHGDREMMTMPLGALLRSVMLNHWYHHRGQLSVYLRQVGALGP
jgi:uncharacterized damage-inducible protein DinB